MVKYLLKYLLNYVETLLILFGALTLSALIPQSALYKNALSSAISYKKSPPQETADGSHYNTTIDNYADVVEIGVMWNMSAPNPFVAALDSKYYDGNDGTKDYGENYGLYKNIKDGFAPNTDYSRYWHGGAIFLRTMHLLTDIQHIRSILFLISLLLIALICYRLFKTGNSLIAILFVVSLIAVQFWNIRLSFEFELAMLVALPIVLYCITHIHKANESLSVWIVSGTLIAFFDILTCELLTLALPIALLLAIRQRKGELLDLRSELLAMAKKTIVWGTAYLVTFLSKWGLASLAMGENRILNAIEAASVRVGGEVDTPMSTIELFFSSIPANLSVIMGGTERVSWSMVIIAFLIIGCALFYIYYNRRKMNIPFITLMLVLALMPFIRSLILSHHSYLHNYFTYRALAIPVFAILTICFIGQSAAPANKSSKK